MFIFLAGILLHRRSFKKEGFAASNLNNEKVQKKERQRWHDELVMMEEPEAVQVKTDDPVLQYDKVTDEESAPWFGEGILNERPQGIQDKPVGEVPEYDKGGASYGRH